jgi:uncharacterized membrane protein YgcG
LWRRDRIFLFLKSVLYLQITSPFSCILLYLALLLHHYPYVYPIPCRRRPLISKSVPRDRLGVATRLVPPVVQLSRLIERLARLIVRFVRWTTSCSATLRVCLVCWAAEPSDLHGKVVGWLWLLWPTRVNYIPQAQTSTQLKQRTIEHWLAPLLGTPALLCRRPALLPRCPALRRLLCSAAAQPPSSVPPTLLNALVKTGSGGDGSREGRCRGSGSGKDEIGGSGSSGSSKFLSS